NMCHMYVIEFERQLNTKGPLRIKQIYFHTHDECYDCAAPGYDELMKINCQIDELQERAQWLRKFVQGFRVHDYFIAHDPSADKFRSTSPLQNVRRRLSHP